jgi:hypothetical protein
MNATIITVLTATVLAASGIAAAGELAPEQRQAHFQLGQDHLAIEGYDPVGYFPEGGGKPRRGDPSITATHGGVTYRFASEENRARFVENPSRYEPAYGGWCAYAMGKTGDKVDINPEAYEVHEGRLYLFYKTLFTDTVGPWKKSRAELKPKADAHWSQHLAG